MARANNRNPKIVPGAERALDNLKYEIAKNLGIQDLVDANGWTGLTTLQAGQLGGAITQVITTLGSLALIDLDRKGQLSQVVQLPQGTQPEKNDLTRVVLANYSRMAGGSGTVDKIIPNAERAVPLSQAPPAVPIQ